MKARITLTVHGLNHLDGVQLARLQARLTDLFGLVPGIFGDTMVSTFLTDDHKRVFTIIEDLNVELAIKYHPDLWTSIASEEAQG